MEAFRQFMENYTSVSEENWIAVSNCFEKRSIEKDDLLLKEGQICNYLYFIEEGLLRYYINKDGNEITKFFTEAPYCFTSQVSFTSAQPAKENIQALERSVIWQINLKDATELLEIKSWNTFVRKLIQEVQFYTEALLEEMQTYTAEKRYKKMLKDQPELLQRIQLNYLASYFGIAPQSLSRIRKNLVSKSRS